MSRVQRLVQAGLAYAGAIAMLTSCDPCAGVASCSTSPRVAVQGRIVDVNTGRGVSGARIYLVRTDAPSRDSGSVVTDGEGNYQVEVGTGTGTFDVGVSPVGLTAYQVHGLKLESSTRTGAGHVLGVWVATPVFGVAAELVYRTSGLPVLGGTVSFRRTGGVSISGPNGANGVYTSSVDGTGRVSLLSGVTANGADDVIGELTISLPDVQGVSVIPGVHVRPSYEFRPRDVLRLAVGPELSWILKIYDRATVTGVPGTTVSFRRTGGIRTSPETFTATTNKDGDFLVPLVPLAFGTVVGDLTVQPPPPFRSYVKTGIEFTTFDADGVRYLPGLGVGPHLPWLGVVQCGGKALAGANVTVVRVGGIAATPQELHVTSDENGYFSLNFKPADYGDLIVDLEFFPPPGSGCIGYVQHNLHLPTLDFDTGGRFIAAWDLPK